MGANRFAIAALGLSFLLSGPPAARAQSLSYTYDALGRLATVTYPNGSLTTYSYDAADNRSQVTTAGSALRATGSTTVRADAAVTTRLGALPNPPPAKTLAPAQAPGASK